MKKIKYLFLLFLIIPFINIKALELTTSTYEGYTFDLPSDIREHFFFYSSNRLQDYNTNYVVGSTENFYIVEKPTNNVGAAIGNDLYIKSYRTNISKELYDSWVYYLENGGTNPLRNCLNGSCEDGIGYHIPNTDLYYMFAGSPDLNKLKQYRIDRDVSNHTITLTRASGTVPFRATVFASNENLYLYSQSGINKPQLYRTAPYGIKMYNVTFHLNGGTAVVNLGGNTGGSSGSGHSSGPSIKYEDYTVQVYDNLDLENYLAKVRIRNDLLTFNWWYYDSNLINPYRPSNVIDNDIDLYASYEYSSVESVVNNISFDEYTFPDDKRFAVISVKNNFSQGLYIGLGFNFQFLDAYKYVIENNEFVNGSFMSLNSIGSVNNKYYYHIGQLNSDSSMVIVLDKDNFKVLKADDSVEYYHTFWVSSNTYVYYTNDLTSVEIYSPSGELIEDVNISQNYDYSQKFLLNSNSDIITKFIALVKNGDFSIFEFMQNIWAKLRGYKLFNYFLLLSLGSIIVALVKGGSRH